MQADYIIIGAGSAGCVLANRLSASGHDRVVLLEAGGSDARFWVRTPIGYGLTINDPNVNWMYQSESEPALGGREIFVPRGKLLGGSSAINAMVYARGIAADFEDWKGAGNPDWGAAEMNAAFARVEAELEIWQGFKDFHPIRENFRALADELGVANYADFNSDQPYGIGAYVFSMKPGRRFSASDAFLYPIKSRQNLLIETGACVDRVLFEEGRAKGVAYIQNGVAREVLAAKRVILAAGAIGSPMLLQRSGIGDGKALAPLGLAPVVDNPNVGAHLQDHIGISYHFDAKCRTLNPVLGTWHGRIGAGVKYLLTKGGPMGRSVNEMGALLKTDAGDLQFYFNPISFDRTVSGQSAKPYPDAKSGITIAFSPARPKSEGRVMIRDRQIDSAPKIAFNYLSHDEDLKAVEAGFALTKRMVEAKALAPILGAAHYVDFGRFDLDEFWQDFRARAGTVYHPCGTVRMAAREMGGVLDQNCAVYGVNGLSVVDASAFPNITSMNTNAPAIAFADHAARRILASDLA